LFLTELLQRYLAALRSDAYASSEEPRIRYRDFIALERATIADAGIRAFWDRRVVEFPALAFPPRREPARHAETRRIATTTIAWDARTVEKLKETAACAGASMKSALLAAHFAVLSTLANQRDVVTGLITNGRPEENGADAVLGLFLNTIPICGSIGNRSWIDLMKAAFGEGGALLRYRRCTLVR